MNTPKEKAIKQIRKAELIANFIINSWDKVGSDKRTLEFFESRVPILDGYWKEFMEVHDNLLDFSVELQESEYFKKDMFAETERNYSYARAFLSNKIKAFLREAASTSDLEISQNSRSLENPVSLRTKRHAIPKLTLPKFAGVQAEWESFKDLFSSIIVENGDVPLVEKLQHLLNCLEGDAARCVEGLTVTAANFELAWEKLIRRYDNKNLRLASHMQALLHLPLVKYKSASGLKKLLDTAEREIKGLTSLRCPVEHFDIWLVHLIVEKLDSDTRESWEISQENKTEFPKYKDLLAFLENRIRSLEQSKVDSNKALPVAQVSERSEKWKPKKSFSSAHSGSVGKGKPNWSKKLTCPFCSEAHSLTKCEEFQNCTVTQRREKVMSRKLCLICLGKDHIAAACPSEKRCYVCHGKHYTALHMDGISKKQAYSTSLEEETVGTTASGSVAHLANEGTTRVLLATANIILKAKNGQFIEVRALIDPGAERSFISRHVALLLGVERQKSNVYISGVGGSVTAVASESAELILGSTVDASFSLDFTAMILGRLTSLIPSQETLVSKNLQHLIGLQLADPNYARPASVDCILGAEIYPGILLRGVRKGNTSEPIAQETRFGWILSGPVEGQTGRDGHARAAHHVNVLFTQEEVGIADALQKFWEIEKVPEKPLLSPEEEECERLFLKSCRRMADGRFSVGLPFRSEPVLDGSREIALACWRRTENRLAKNAELKMAYDEFMHEYLQLKHMELIPKSEYNKQAVYYIPHHAIFKKGKIRVVFNASQKSHSGHSLNDFLHIGQKLQNDIALVMTRWRFFGFVFCTDIVKMFRQLLVNKEDRDWLRILYRCGESAIQQFRLCTVTYGTAPAPFQALRVLKQIITEECRELPIIAEILEKQTYVDDIFAGADSIRELIEIRDDLICVLGKAQIPLGKWSANHTSILGNIANVETQGKSLEIQEVVSTLGLKWLPNADSFFFEFESPKRSSDAPTKRLVLSESSKLYDPLGWLAPVLVATKILMQDLWIKGFDWDSPLDKGLAENWLEIQNQLSKLSLIRVPRWFGGVKGDDWALHGFSDASKRAYAACLYYVPKIGPAKLIFAKARISPVKTLSIPRLELLGAVLLADIISWIEPTFPVAPSEVHCWCDSRNVLYWLDSVPARWGVFEANRVSKIITILPDVRWKHVRSADNPADCATRGLSVSQLSDFSLWWEGPPWLKDKAKWPVDTPPLEVSEENSQIQALTATDRVPQEEAWIFSISSYSRLIRVVAYCLRWRGLIQSGNQKSRCLKSWLSTEELTRAKLALVRLDQSISFGKETDLLRNNQPVWKGSHLVRLKPFLDKKNLIRVGGRLSNCKFLSYEERHPLIIAKNGPLANLLVKFAHEVTLHGGPQLVFSHISRQFWIINGKRLIQKLLANCPTCIRFGGKTLSQEMAPLPEIRVTPQRAFYSTGLDYAGPIKVRTSKGRGIKSSKGWIAIFVCLVTRAIHVEIVSDLTSQTFLAAFNRFISRRGLPNTIFSDNGTTFQGASKEISELFRKNGQFMKTVGEQVENKGIKWSFIPPRAPHFGGLWEAAVRSFKHHLKRVIGDSSLTFEELSTLSTQIEACLNSRPLCAVSIDGRDSVPLTPGHFLIGSELISLPQDFSQVNLGMHFSDRWKLLLAMKNDFWAKWRKEVLNQFIQLNKWVFPKRNLKIGDLVIIKDDFTPPTHWPIGRVTEVYVGASDLVRVVKIKTQNGEFKRSIDRLIYLPVDHEASESLKVYLAYTMFI